jgi:hypothetical protein
MRAGLQAVLVVLDPFGPDRDRVRSPTWLTLTGLASITSPSSSCTTQVSPLIFLTVPISVLFSPMNWATKLFCGRSYSSSGGASCWMRPSSNTATRSDMVSASVWSWVT